jgi:hypothetical protein
MRDPYALRPAVTDGLPCYRGAFAVRESKNGAHPNLREEGPMKRRLDAKCMM